MDTQRICSKFIQKKKKKDFVRNLYSLKIRLTKEDPLLNTQKSWQSLLSFEEFVIIINSPYKINSLKYFCLKRKFIKIFRCCAVVLK